MSQVTDETSSQDAESSENGTGSAAAVPFQQQIDELIDAISKIADDIANAKSGIDTANQELEEKRAREKELTGRKATLQRLLDGFTTDRKKVSQQRESADSLAVDARKKLKDIRDRLQQQLTDDHRKAIDTAIRDVDREITDLETARDDKREERDEAENALAKAKSESMHAEAELRNAQNELRGLTSTLQKCAADVRKTQSSLESELKRGNATRAYLHTIELDDALSTLEQSLDPALEESLTMKIQTTWARYRDARDHFAESEKQVSRLRQEQSQLSKKFDDSRKKRDKSIDEKIEGSLSSTAAPGATDKGGASKPADAAGV